MGGLTAALCMSKKGFQVKVYEKMSVFARLGGPIQFASSTLSILKEIVKHYSHGLCKILPLPEHGPVVLRMDYMPMGPSV